MKILLLSEGLTIGETLKGAMFPEKVKFFGAMIDPTLAAAFLVTFTLLLLALLIRIFVIPKFTKTQQTRNQGLSAAIFLPPRCISASGLWLSFSASGP
jgi:type II secretory pathway component PulF